MNNRQKYYLVEWPESKPFPRHPDCIQSDGMSFFIPCELIDSKYEHSGTE